MIFTLFDMIIFSTIILSSMLGLYRGAVSITINLIGLVASVVAAVFLYAYMQEFVGTYIENALIKSIVSGVSAYLVSLMVFTFISSKIILFLSPIRGGMIDRIFGLFVGIIRGGAIALLLFFGVVVFSSKTYNESEYFEEMITKLSYDKYPEWLKESKTTPYLDESLKISVSYLPESLSKYPLEYKSKNGLYDGENDGNSEKNNI